MWFGKFVCHRYEDWTQASILYWKSISTVRCFMVNMQLTTDSVSAVFCWIFQMMESAKARQWPRAKLEDESLTNRGVDLHPLMYLLKAALIDQLIKDGDSQNLHTVSRPHGLRTRRLE